MDAQFVTKQLVIWLIVHNPLGAVSERIDSGAGDVSYIEQKDIFNIGRYKEINS